MGERLQSIAVTPLSLPLPLRHPLAKKHLRGFVRHLKRFPPPLLRRLLILHAEVVGGDQLNDCEFQDESGVPPSGAVGDVGKCKLARRL